MAEHNATMEATLAALLNDKKYKIVIEYYQKAGKLVLINGDQSIDKVFEDITKTLG